MLPLTVKEDDFVAIKLDIDGGPEMQIAFGLINRPEIAALVDEIYFEYHFYFDGINFVGRACVSLLLAYRTIVSYTPTHSLLLNLFFCGI